MWELASQAYAAVLAKGRPPTDVYLHYGEVLLHLGNHERAEQMFKRYYDRRVQSTDAARQIADALHQAQHYEAAEPYLKQMFLSGNQSSLDVAFHRLAEIYAVTEQRDAIPNLIAEYLSRAQNPSRARREILNRLTAHGLWDMAVGQLERMSKVQGEADVAFEIGQNLFRAGELDKARAALRTFATEHVRPEDAWLQVGYFYRDHGMVAEAREAYDAAVHAASDRYDAYQQRGDFRIATGDVAGGRKDYERARSKAPQTHRGKLWEEEVTTLLQFGRGREARAVARSALTEPYTQKEFFLDQIARIELASGDKTRAERMIEELRQAGLPLKQLVALVRDHGYLEEAVRLIDDEVANGDLVGASEALQENLDVYTRLGGTDRLMSTARRLLERAGTGQDAALLYQNLGAYLVARGHLEQGAIFLRAARQQGSHADDHALDTQLAFAYLAQGFDQEAERLFLDLLASAPAAELKEGLLRNIAARYEIQNKRDVLRALLEHLARDERHAALAMPMLLDLMLDAGQPLQVIALLRGGPWMAPEGPAAARPEPEAQQPMLLLSAVQGSDEVAGQILVGGLETLAGAGYLQEARSLLAELDPSWAQTSNLQDFSRRLAAVLGPDEARAAFGHDLKQLGAVGVDAQERIELAELLLVNGRHELVNEMLAPVLQSGVEGERTQAFDLKLRNLYASGHVEEITPLIAGHLQASPDRQNARLVAATTLRELGLDDEALALLEANVEQAPTEIHLSNALQTAYFAGDVEAWRSLDQRLHQVADRPLDDAEQSLHHFGVRFEDAFTKGWIERHDEFLGRKLHIKLDHIGALYRAGQVEQARQLLRDYLVSIEHDPLFTEYILSQLRADGLHGEVARVIAPTLPAKARTPGIDIQIGASRLAIGRDREAALRLLDKAISRRHDPADAAVTLAEYLLLQERDVEAALHFASQAMSHDPTRPLARFYRGLAALASGEEGEAVTQDVEQGLDGGPQLAHQLHVLGQVALRAKRFDVAEQALLRLAHSAPQVTFLQNEAQQLEGLSRALRLYAEEGQARRGVAFLEDHFPQIAFGHGTAARNVVLLSVLSSLYEEAGMEEKSFGMYRENILREQVAAPLAEDTNLPTYRNNLAYSFSTTNTHIGEGVDLVRLAIATSGLGSASDNGRQPSYIDTLGWLLYRQGDLAQAEAEIRRAIRSQLGNPDQLTELYGHLAEILVARGHQPEAVWIEIFTPDAGR